MAIGRNIKSKKKDKEEKLIKNTEEKEIFQPGQPSNNPKADTYGTKRWAIYIKKNLYQKIKNYVYWTPGETVTNTLNEAVQEFLKNKKTKSIPKK
jgi:hypothetical protein